MGPFTKFFIRLILSAGVAFLIGFFYFRERPVLKALGLTATLLVLAYLFEHTRKRDRGEENGT